MIILTAIVAVCVAAGAAWWYLPSPWGSACVLAASIVIVRLMLSAAIAYRHQKNFERLFGDALEERKRELENELR